VAANPGSCSRLSWIKITSVRGVYPAIWRYYTYFECRKVSNCEGCTYRWCIVGPFLIATELFARYLPITVGIDAVSVVRALHIRYVQGDFAASSGAGRFLNCRYTPQSRGVYRLISSFEMQPAMERCMPPPYRIPGVQARTDAFRLTSRCDGNPLLASLSQLLHHAFSQLLSDILMDVFSNTPP
jgi:hypothetical protein